MTGKPPKEEEADPLGPASVEVVDDGTSVIFFLTLQTTLR
jgi:hypothetical protein